MNSDSSLIRSSIKNLSGECNLPSGEYIFTKVEILPAFPGGYKKWFEFSNKNFEFSIIAKGIPDSVKHFHDSTMVKFVVTKNGDICGFTFLFPTKEPLKTAVLNLFSKSPNWKPAESGSRQLNAYKQMVIEVSYDKKLGVGKIMNRYLLDF